MAEFVNQRIELMLNELEQMKRIELYTPEEIKIIAKKRKDFEYKIQRHIKCKEDFYNYITYECILLQDIKLRRENLNIKEKKSDVEYAISKRVIKLFKEMINRFPEDIEIWLKYMEFCKTADYINSVTSYMEKLVQIHGDKPKIWQLAARWEYEERNNIDNARQFLLKGLQRHTDFEDLYIDLLRVELLVAEPITDEAEQEKQLKRVEIVFNSALKNIKSTNFIIKLYHIVDDFECTLHFKTKLINELWENHRDNSETWAFIANCELKEKDISGFDWMSLGIGYFSSDYPPNLQKFVDVHEIAINQIQTKQTIISFINSSIKLISNDNFDNLMKLQVISNAISKGHSKKCLNEKYYKIWLDLLCSDRINNIDRTEILEILEEACSYLPTSVFLWLERMKRTRDNMHDLLNLFKKAKQAIPTENVGEIWKFIIEQVNDLTILKDLYKQSLMLLPKVASVVRPLFLVTFYEKAGIKVAREEYKSMAINSPFILELHNVMIEIENEQENPDVGHLRHCLELSTQQFGAKEPDVWLTYVEFEILNKHPEKCSALYKRACICLEASLINRFIAEYGEIMMKK